MGNAADRWRLEDDAFSKEIKGLRSSCRTVTRRIGPPVIEACKTCRFGRDTDEGGLRFRKKLETALRCACNQAGTGESALVETVEGSGRLISDAVFLDFVLECPEADT